MMIVVKHSQKVVVFNRHIISVHQKEKKFKCDACDKAFSQIGHLKSHIKTVHRGEKDYNCDDCGKAFPSSSNLNRHMKKVHHAALARSEERR